MDDKAFQNVLQMSFIIFYLKISGSRECFCSQQDYAESTKINKNKYMKRKKKTEDTKIPGRTKPFCFKIAVKRRLQHKNKLYSMVII